MKRSHQFIHTLGFLSPNALPLNGFIGSIKYQGDSVNITGEKSLNIFYDTKTNTGNPAARYSTCDTSEGTDFQSIVEIQDQRKRLRGFLEAASEWRNKQTKLDVNRLSWKCSPHGKYGILRADMV